MIMEAPLPTMETIAPPVRKTSWQRLWRDPFARLGLIVLAMLYFAAAFASPLTPYSMYFNDEVRVQVGLAPKTLVGLLCNEVYLSSIRFVEFRGSS